MTALVADLAEGTKVFAATDLKTRSDNTVPAVRFGDPGVVQKSVNGRINVAWERSHHNGAALVLSGLSQDMVSLEAPPFVRGQWVRFEKDVRFRSNRRVQKGCHAIVLDLLQDSDSCPTVLVRAAPFHQQAAFDFCVSACDIRPLAFQVGQEIFSPDELPGGFHAADLVYATQDLGSNPVLVGRGDVGIVLGPGRPAGDPDRPIMIRFEASREKGHPVMISLPVASISREPVLCTGRRVQLNTAVRFPNGQTVEMGKVGTLIDDIENSIQVSLDINGKADLRAFKAPMGSLTVFHEQPYGAGQEEELSERLAELEFFADANERSGNATKTMSLLQQNLFAVHGYGSGVGISFLVSDRVSVLANSLRCLILRKQVMDGFDGTLANESNNAFSHDALANDTSRNRPYISAIEKYAHGRRVLDIGTGPFALWARLSLKNGAESVDAVEANIKSIKLAIDGFQAETSSNGVPEWALLNDAAVCEADGPDGLQMKLEVAGHSDAPPQELFLYHGLSSDATLGLRGGYTMLVHEILGDFAGTEGAAAAVNDIRSRGLLAPDCVCVPRKSSTLLAPTSVLEPSLMEKLLHRLAHAGTSNIQPLVRHGARYFHKKFLLAEPQPLEILDFQGGIDLVQNRTLEFRTERDGAFDGVHMHLFVDLDGEEFIDTLAIHSRVTDNPQEDSTWSTTYIKLVEMPIILPAGSRIVVRCRANLEGALAHYALEVLIGEASSESVVASCEWKGGA
eukprot:TRINITY_DN31062_c0_g1_i1.p1 TRINITY_DN31062_c0_g1~~TRINITY_DN31062_c0_g1_i1.p1  ORF type:complete len:738 (+),score=97.73 TRINITY_DN31062_c0_g1_i1:178-2391(+)